MASFKNIAAQGELYIRRVKKVPAGCTAMKASDGKFVVGHSETGHHHVIAEKNASVMVLDRPSSEGMRILYAILKDPSSLVHLRGHDTHETIDLEPGIYEIRIARDFDHYAELARQSAD
jgi:hypothetical protein